MGISGPLHTQTRRLIRFKMKVLGLKSHAHALHMLKANLTTTGIMPNVKDEPRPSLARLVQQKVERSVFYFR